MVQLTQQEIQGYLQQGYSMQEINEASNIVDNQEKGVVDPRATQRFSSFTAKHDENLIKWQLELNEMLERAEHILKGDILKFEGGNITWKDNPNPEKNILNNEGVQETMKILSMYLNRNTILSDYEQVVINGKMFDFGKELNDLFSMKYEKLFYLRSYKEHAELLGFGFKKLSEFNEERKMLELKSEKAIGDQLLLLSTADIGEVGESYPEMKEKFKEIIKLESQDAMIKREMEVELSYKIKNYPMLIRSLIDIVHSAYQRALDGGERRSLREARQVQQTEVANQQQFGGYPQMPKKSIIKPWTWMK